MYNQLLNEIDSLKKQTSAKDAEIFQLKSGIRITEEGTIEEQLTEQISNLNQIHQNALL